MLTLTVQTVAVVIGGGLLVGVVVWAVRDYLRLRAQLTTLQDSLVAARDAASNATRRQAEDLGRQIATLLSRQSSFEGMLNDSGV